jgi:hypothetical protein
MCRQNSNKQVIVESTFSSLTPVMLLVSHTGRGDASNSVGTMVEPTQTHWIHSIRMEDKWNASGCCLVMGLVTNGTEPIYTATR